MLRTLILMVALGLMPALAFAQNDVDIQVDDADADVDVRYEEGVEEEGPEAGDWELLLSGSGSNDPDFDAGSFGLGASVGYFFTDALEGSIRQNIGFADADDAGSSWNASTRVAVDYHFDLGAWQPFVGANIGYLYGDDIEESWIAAPEAGLKWYVKDDTFIYGLAEYQFPLEESASDGFFVYSVGVGFNF